MQEWIIAMLVISVLLILRDMAKTILTGRMSKKEEIFPILILPKRYNTAPNTLISDKDRLFTKLTIGPTMLP